MTVRVSSFIRDLPVEQFVRTIHSLQVSAQTSTSASLPKQLAPTFPQLLSGSVPENNGDNVGSRNYSKSPAAVVLGEGFTAAEFDDIRKACEGMSTVPWLRADTSKPPTVPSGPEHGKHIAARMKEALNRLEAEGKFGEDGSYLF